jgi:hypothetical protein
MPSRANALGHGSICRAQALGLTGRCEPLPVTLPWPRGPMGGLTPMSEVATLPVVHPGPSLACRAPVACELIRQDAAWHTPQALEPPAKARFRGLRLGPTWHQDLPDLVVLIDGPPQVMAFAVNGQTQFIHMPSIMCPRGGVAGDAADGHRLARTADPMDGWLHRSRRGRVRTRVRARRGRSGERHHRATPRG